LSFYHRSSAVAGVAPRYFRGLSAPLPALRRTGAVTDGFARLAVWPRRA